MLATTSDKPACADAPNERLAAQVSDIAPGAVAIRVSLTDPTRTWPQPHAIALDASGQRIELHRTAAQVAARWVQRAWPGADWNQPHTFDIGTATFTCGTVAAARRSR
ncbi:transcriptional regulator [Streptomyces sp. NPDC060035]|uniref:transcriptional regulator n=1 Tax=Streptomyces sp. NPDC060035 TaxID=3347044 RepID=UPI0036888A7F